MVKKLLDKLIYVGSGLIRLIGSPQDYLMGLKIASYGFETPEEERFARIVGIMGPKRGCYTSLEVEYIAKKGKESSLDGVDILPKRSGRSHYIPSTYLDGVSFPSVYHPKRPERDRNS